VGDDTGVGGANAASGLGGAGGLPAFEVATFVGSVWLGFSYCVVLGVPASANPGEITIASIAVATAMRKDLRGVMLCVLIPDPQFLPA
jgi:hypothetical protein